MKNSARYSFRLNDKFPYSEENIAVTVAQSRDTEKKEQQILIFRGADFEEVVHFFSMT